MRNSSPTTRAYKLSHSKLRYDEPRRVTRSSPDSAENRSIEEIESFTGQDSDQIGSSRRSIVKGKRSKFFKQLTSSNGSFYDNETHKVPAKINEQSGEEGSPLAKSL